MATPANQRDAGGVIGLAVETLLANIQENANVNNIMLAMDLIAKFQFLKLLISRRNLAQLAVERTLQYIINSREQMLLRDTADSGGTL